MPDQHGVVTAHLKNMGLAEKWQVVEPVSGGLRGDVWIQNAEEQLDAFVELAPGDSDLLGEEEIRERIRTALNKPKKRA
jgi:hypothetical protein